MIGLVYPFYMAQVKMPDAVVELRGRLENE